VVANESKRRPTLRIGRTLRPYRRSNANNGPKTNADITSERAYKANVNAGFKGTWRANRTPAGMPGPTGAQKSANTSMTGPPGKWPAAVKSRSAPAFPTKAVGSSAVDGEKISNPLATGSLEHAFHDDFQTSPRRQEWPGRRSLDGRRDRPLEQAPDGYAPVNIHTFETTYHRGSDTLRGYLAVPASRGASPGLVLIPDVRGLSDHFRDVARRFAGEGFATLAVNLYSREGAPDLPDMDAVFRWMASLPDRRVLADLHAARDFLSSHDAVRGSKVGVTGFCMGGQYALMAACARWGFRACVSWYGMLRYASTSETKPESPLDMSPRLTCPYLGFFGEQDSLIPLADVAELKHRLAGRKHPGEIYTYANAGHAFFNDSRPELFRPAAAADAWPRALAFLRRHLGQA
jgi:carboxymethylenebutenolidase